MIETALIDGDIVAYRCAAATANETEDIAKWQASEMMQRIIHETNAMQYRCYLTGTDNFRYTVYPQYKANRKDIPRPAHLQAVREHLVKEWNATVTDGIEADDAIGIEHQLEPNTVACSIDKDFLMLPGMHYNFVKQEFRMVSPLEGLRHFYWQLIMGDRSDNIPGYDGKMRQKVPKFLEEKVQYLDSLTEEIDMFQMVYDMYCNGIGLEQMMINGQLLWIHRKEGDDWLANTENLYQMQTNNM